MAKKQLQGKVVSNKMQKTVVISVESIKESRKYKKRYKVHKRFKAHAGDVKYNLGDTVLIQECRPMSKDKKWQVIKKIAESKLIDEEPTAELTETK